MSEAAFLRRWRLAKSGIILARVAKGMYMKSASSKGDDVLNHFGENNDNGVYIGTRLIIEYGISDVRSDEIWLYSNSISKANL